MASGPAPGWRNPNQTQKNCKLCQIEEGVHKELCSRQGPGVRGWGLLGAPQAWHTLRTWAILCRPQLRQSMCVPVPPDPLLLQNLYPFSAGCFSFPFLWL